MIRTLLVYEWSVQKTTKKPQTNQKHNRKGMWLGCEQPFLWGEHCMTSQTMAAKETTCHVLCANSNVKSVIYRNICNNTKR